MDWIIGIQRALDYVEEHITEYIDYEELAKCAYSSSFHFQRVFSAICGFTLGDYIRFRRLSLAGGELAQSGAKVIDVALKYGYDTPESFSRAFKRFHGKTPTQVKNGAMLKSFSRLSVKLILQGGNTMDYRIEKKGAFDIMVKKNRFPKQKEITNSEIPAFWQTCHEDGTVKKLVTYIPEGDEFGLMGIGMYDINASDFDYGIGVCRSNKKIEDTGFEVETIPEHTYVVFKCKGKMPEAFMDMYRYICTEFFPASEYRPCGVEIEAYPSSDVQNLEYTCELWIAVEKVEKN